ncbi:ras and EF-hand domain-containing protein-like isoform X5 [Sus scrofa]|uniref:ras and EF-hand domain-containing protein-like isoform X5 n=1 Tax=Sus scrofa TaxID=9823 RepID=UPI000A2B2E16|nr:ras and EF-hand domain-containing protein-like isoform X5 [Sus scrofa]
MADAEAVLQRLGARPCQEFVSWGQCLGWGPRELVPIAAPAVLDPGDSKDYEGDEHLAAALAAPWDPVSLGGAWQDIQARLGNKAKFTSSSFEARCTTQKGCYPHRKNTKLREPSVTSDVSIETEVGDLQVTMKKLKKMFGILFS